MRALVIALHWEHRSWWKPLMQMTLEAYQLPSPATGALLYHDENLTPHPQRSWSTVAVYVDGMSAPDDLTKEEQGMSSKEESDEDASPNKHASVALLTYCSTDPDQGVSAASFHPSLQDEEAQSLDHHWIAEIETKYGSNPRVLKHYRKERSAIKLLAAIGVVESSGDIDSPLANELRAAIKQAYAHDVFRGEVRLKKRQDHPTVLGSNAWAQIDRYENCKPKPQCPIRLVRGKVAAEKEIAEDFFVRGSIELAGPSE